MMNENWVSCLQAYTLPSLQTVCRTRGITVREGMNKSALSRLVSMELFRSSALKTLLSDLRPSERQWLALFRKSEGVLPLPSLARAKEKEEYPAPALSRLAARGLVLPGPFDGHIPQGTFDVSSPDGPLWCPDTVLRLSAGEPYEPALRPYRGEVVNVTPANLRVFEHDLMAVADQIRQAPPRRLKSGFPGKRFLARAAARLLVPATKGQLRRMETSGRLLFLYDVLGALGAIRSRHSRIITSHGADEFFGKPPLERVARTLEAWQQAVAYNELYQIEELSFEREFPDYRYGDGKEDDLPTPEKLQAARRFLVSLAAHMGGCEWISLDELINAAYRSDDAFLMKPPQSSFYAHAPLYCGVMPSDASSSGAIWSWGLERAGNWPLVEGRFIREVFRGSLHRLGLVDIAETPDGALLVRLNDVGAWLVAGGPEPRLSPAPRRALVVQPNFDVVVFPEGQDVSLLWPLLQASEVISRDVTLTLRLTADSIHRAAQQGASAGSVLSLLEHQARSPVPDNVRQAMDDWEQRHRQVTITTDVDFVEAESPERLSRFLRDVNADCTVVRPLSDTVGLVVGPASRLPHMTALDYRNPLPPSVWVSPDLDITIDPARENWRVRPCLCAIAEKTGPHSFRLTRESVAGGAKNGHLYDEISELLRFSAIDGMPLRAEFRLQGLYGHLGPTSVAEVVLLQTAREAVLTTMLEIEDFRELILQRLSPTTALVKADRTNDLLEKLEQFGIPNDPDALREVQLPAPRKRSAGGAQASARRGERLQTHSTRKTRELLEEAIRQGRRVRLRYRPQPGVRAQERTVDPIDVERRHGVSYLTAYSHLRGEVQVFRVPSIVALELLDTPISPR